VYKIKKNIQFQEQRGHNGFLSAKTTREPIRCTDSVPKEDSKGQVMGVILSKPTERVHSHVQQSYNFFGTKESV